MHEYVSKDNVCATLIPYRRRAKCRLQLFMFQSAMLYSMVGRDLTARLGAPGAYPRNPSLFLNEGFLLVLLQ